MVERRKKKKHTSKQRTLMNSGVPSKVVSVWSYAGSDVPLEKLAYLFLS